MDLRDELLGLIDALDTAGLDYAVCGGLALAIHGHPRFTKDIDLLVRREDLDPIATVVERCGFVLDAGVMPFGVGTDRVRPVRRISKVEGKEILTLDLLIVGPALQEIWRGRGVFAWADRNLQVASREGLIAMKKLAGREQDLVDARRLESGDDDTGQQE